MLHTLRAMVPSALAAALRPDPRSAARPRKLPLRPTFIRIPPGASPGLPVVIDRLDGMTRVLHDGGPHSHGFFSFLFAVRGEGSMDIGRRRVRVEPGTMVITVPGETHDTRRLRGVDRWAVSFTPDALGTSAAAWLFPSSDQAEWLALLRRPSGSARTLVVPPGERLVWKRHLADIAGEIRLRHRGYREAIRAHLKLILIGAARLAAEPGEPEARAPLLDEVFRVIEAGFARQLSLSEVARTVGRSPAHLTTVVRTQTGLTVQQWVIERRMAEARQRLVATDENVTVVAERSGYQDPSLFSRHFRRAHGMTPGEWRHGEAAILRPVER